MPGNEQNNDLSCLVLLTGKVLFCLIVSVLSATAGGAAERQRAVGDIEAAETPGGGVAKAPAQEHRRMARLASPHQRTGAVAGLCHGKVGKRLPEGPHKRRGGAAARCHRHLSSGDARRKHRRSRLAPERGCHEVTGLRWRACAASAGVRGYALHKDTAEWLD